MAKQVGPLFITGTIDGIIFYKLNDKYYIRSKGDYPSAKCMRKQRRYTRTFINADRFGEASQLVRDHYYRHLSKEARKHGLFGQLTGMVNQWLYQGKRKEAAKADLIEHLAVLTAASGEPAPIYWSQQAAQATPPVNVQATTAEAKPPAVTPPPVLQPTPPPKQARYLSKWKVKRSGRLHVPRHEAKGLLITPSRQAITVQQEQALQPLRE